MPHGSVWWYPNYVEYGTGLNPPRTWPAVKEQYRRPDSVKELRHYDLPTTENMDALYFRYPRLLPPKYRGLFRDKPHCVTKYYPEEMDVAEGKAKGFHGRQYYEDGPPQFKYNGRKSNELQYLEQPPYAPTTAQSLHSQVACQLDSPRQANELNLRTSQDPSLPRIRPGQCPPQHIQRDCDSWNPKERHLNTIRSTFYTSYPPQKIVLNGM